MKTKSCLIALMCMLFLGACEKPENPEQESTPYRGTGIAPGEYEDGYYFKATVNGKPWYPEVPQPFIGGAWRLAEVSIYYHEKDKELRIVGNRNVGNDQKSLELVSYEFELIPESYDLGNPADRLQHARTNNGDIFDSFETSAYDSTNYFRIHQVDSARCSIEATFQFIARSPEDTSRMDVVTEGRLHLPLVDPSTK